MAHREMTSPAVPQLAALAAGQPAVTIHDVAVLSGLPVRTAFQALCRGGETDAETVARTEAAAAKLAFTVPPTVPSLVVQPVALIVSTATSWVFTEAAASAQAVLAEAGIESLQLSLRRSPEGVLSVQEVPDLSDHFAGSILFGLDLSEREMDLLEAGTATMTSVGTGQTHWQNVGIDDEAAARRATDHLVELGHWNIAILAPEDRADGDGTGMRARRRGFYRALAGHHLDPHPDFDINTHPSIAGGHTSMNELLSNRGVPSAVLAASDEIAFGVLKALEEHGLSSPEDVSLIGMDNHPLSAFARLTTVAQPAADQGALSAVLLLEQFHGRGQPGPRNHYLGTRLIRRGTTRRVRS